MVFENSSIPFSCLETSTYEEAESVEKLGRGDICLAEMLEIACAVGSASGIWICPVTDAGEIGESIASAGTISADFAKIAAIDASKKFRAGLLVDNPEWLNNFAPVLIMRISDLMSSQAVIFYQPFTPNNLDGEELKQHCSQVKTMLGAAWALWLKGQVADECVARSQAITDSCDFGMVIVDPDHIIHQANASARKLFRSCNAFSESNGRFTLRNYHDAMRFAVAFRDVMQAKPSSDPYRSVMITCSGDITPLVITIRRMVGELDGKYAVLHLSDPSMAPTYLLGPLAEAYNLSPVETRLVEQVVQGRTLKDAAKILQLKVQTARTYMKQIFQKTGRHRQIELVQLVQNAALPSL